MCGAIAGLSATMRAMMIWEELILGTCTPHQLADGSTFTAWAARW